MTNEIKEILDYFKREEKNKFGFNQAKILDDEQAKVLLDYITDLQEEIKEYEQLIDIQDKREYHKRYLEERRKEEPNLLYPDYDEIYKRYYEQKDTITKLQEENKRLKDKNDYLNDTLSSSVEYEELKLRIDKAIEYINSYLPNYDFDHSNLEKLLEILKGEDNES